MIKNGIMIIGCALLGCSVYFSKKWQLYDTLFNDLKSSQRYHLDYIEDVSHLPIDKNMVIFGRAFTEDQKQQFVLKSYINKSQNTNRLWNFSITKQFFLGNLNKQKIYIEPNFSNIIFAYNLQKNNKFQNKKLEERMIKVSSPISCFGTLVRIGDKRVLKPKIIMGIQHQSLLQFLDDEILKLNKKQKYFVIGGTMVIGMHFCYIKYIQYRNQKLVLKKKSQN